MNNSPHMYCKEPFIVGRSVERRCSYMIAYIVSALFNCFLIASRVSHFNIKEDTICSWSSVNNCSHAVQSSWYLVSMSLCKSCLSLSIIPSLSFTLIPYHVAWWCCAHTRNPHPHGKGCTWRLNHCRNSIHYLLSYVPWRKPPSVSSSSLTYFYTLKKYEIPK